MRSNETGVPAEHTIRHGGPALRAASPRELRQAMERVAERWGRTDQPQRPPVRTGWEAVDRAIGGLRRGVLHQWLGLDQPGPWTAPHLLLAHLARAAIAPPSTEAHTPPSAGHVLWIGRRCWPHPWTLRHPTPGSHAPLPGSGPLGRSDGPVRAPLMSRSIYVDPPDPATHLWAIDLALRCPAVAVVVADARTLDRAGARRLQLAAEAGRALVLLVRPAPTAHATSSRRGTEGRGRCGNGGSAGGGASGAGFAWTRWRVAPAPARASDLELSRTFRPAWTLDLLSCKGPQPATTRWVVERDDARGLVHRPATVADPEAPLHPARRAAPAA